MALRSLMKIRRLNHSHSNTLPYVFKAPQKLKTKKATLGHFLIFVPMCSHLLLCMTQANLAFIYELQYDVPRRAQKTCLPSVLHSLAVRYGFVFFLFFFAFD